MIRGIAEQFGWILSTALLLAVSPHAPPPFGYAAALIAILFGPGHGLPDVIFGDRYLTLAERLLLTVLTSVGLSVVSLLALVTLASPLSGPTVSQAVIGLTVVTSLLNLAFGPVRLRRSNRKLASWQRPLSFAGGAALGIVLGTLGWRLIGV